MTHADSTGFVHRCHRFLRVRRPLVLSGDPKAVTGQKLSVDATSPNGSPNLAAIIENQIVVGDATDG